MESTPKPMQISYCQHYAVIPILRGVRLELKSFWLALLTVAGVLVTGCGGITASKSISPASFFIPGLGEARPAPASSPVPSAPASAQFVKAAS
jgi:hypothetical protein